MVEITLENVSKSYPERFGGSKQVLKDITLKIKDGSFTAILGPPGAGKTTLLKIIAGITKPDQGKIYFGSEDVSNKSAQERNTAFVFQSYALYPNMKVFDNIAFPLRKGKMNREEIEGRVREVAEYLKITHILHRYPRECSGGERQRVAIARSLVRKPQVYLFDEPLTNLDYKIREEMRSELRKMYEEMNMTIVYATPSPVEALAMSEEVAVLREGRVEQCGATYALLNQPKNIYVAGYLSYPPMNQLEATIAEVNGRYCLHLLGMDIPIDHLKSKFQGDRVTIGINVGDIKILKEGTPSLPNMPTIAAEVMLCEVTGSETLVHLKCGDDRIRVNVPGVALYTIGEKVMMGIPLKRLFIFDSNGEFISRYGDEIG